jgi:cysteine sulfinate desulfinase/cysteine desulfurase-like protein
MGIEEPLSLNALRLSLSPENTEEEIDTVIETLPRLIKKVRDLTKANHYPH